MGITTQITRNTDIRMHMQVNVETTMVTAKGTDMTELNMHRRMATPPATIVTTKITITVTVTVAVMRTHIHKVKMAKNQDAKVKELRSAAGVFPRTAT